MRTEHNLLVEAPNLAVTRCRRRQIAVSAAPKLGALASLRLHWPEYLMEAGLLGAFMVSACVFGVLYGFPQSPVRQAISSDFLRRLARWAVDGTDRDRDLLFALGKAVRCAHQPLGDTDVLPARQDQVLGRSLLYSVAVRRGSPRAFFWWLSFSGKRFLTQLFDT